MLNKSLRTTVKAPSVIYHYCSLDVFLEIIRKSTLRLTNIKKSNDSEELTFCIESFARGIKRAYRQFSRETPLKYSILSEYLSLLVDNIHEIAFNAIEDASLTYYVSCYSEESDLLSQWRGYANDGNGVALGFYTKPLFDLNLRNFDLNFLPVGYDDELLEKKVFTIITAQLMEIWENGSSMKNGSHLVLYENLLMKSINTMVYNAVLYKNPAFSEEKEWRLIFYPFGNIRNLKRIGVSDTYVNGNYYDRMSEHFHSKSLMQFEISPISYYVKNNLIVSYMDLNYEKIKHRFLSDIIIGPKANIDDLDLRLFLFQQGYDTNKLTIRKSLSTYR